MDWTNKLKFQHLQMLVSIAELGNMTAVAEKMNITQPALSKWLINLEAEIGVTLFERHSKGLRPSAGGRLLLEHARRLLNDLERSRIDLALFQRGSQGSMLIGSSPVATDTVAHATLQLAQRYPDIHISVVESIMSVLLQQLLAGKLDVVVGRMDAQALQLPLSYRVLYTEPVCFVARSDHPLTKQSDISWDDLRRYRWIVWPAGTPIRQSFDNALVTEGIVMPANHVESASMSVTLNMTKASDMLSTLSLHQAKNYEAAGLLTILPQLMIAPHGTVGVFWRKQEQTPDVLDAFLNNLNLYPLS